MKTISDYRDLAKELLAGDWSYDSERLQLKHFLGAREQLKEKGLINEEGFLLAEFKAAVREYLGPTFLQNVRGAFDDEDIFVGVDVDQDIEYYIECNGVDVVKLEQFQALDLAVNWPS